MPFVLLTLGILATFVCLIARRLKVRPLKAWLTGLAIAPLLVLIIELSSSYESGGTPIWPFALLISLVICAIFSFIGLMIAKLFTKANSSKAKH